MMHDMTFTSLAKRADEKIILDCVADYIGGDDLREVTVFLTHEQSDRGEGRGYHLDAKEVIGVALVDLDDPLAAIEILTRDQAVDLFGYRVVADWEEVE